MSGDPTYSAQTERILEGMRKAGVPRTMTATRRLVAILAADAAGYSRLMGEDEGGDGFVYERREAAPSDSVQRKGPVSPVATSRSPQPSGAYGSFTASTHRLACSSKGPPLYRPKVIPVRLWPTTTAMMCSIWSACSALVMK